MSFSTNCQNNQLNTRGDRSTKALTPRDKNKVQREDSTCDGAQKGVKKESLVFERVENERPPASRLAD